MSLRINTNVEEYLEHRGMQFRACPGNEGSYAKKIWTLNLSRINVHTP